MYINIKRPTGDLLQMTLETACLLLKAVTVQHKPLVATARSRALSATVAYERHVRWTQAPHAQGFAAVKSKHTRKTRNRRPGSPLVGSVTALKSLLLDVSSPTH